MRHDTKSIHFIIGLFVGVILAGALLATIVNAAAQEKVLVTVTSGSVAFNYTSDGQTSESHLDEGYKVQAIQQGQEFSVRVIFPTDECDSPTFGGYPDSDTAINAAFAFANNWQGWAFDCP